LENLLGSPNKSGGSETDQDKTFRNPKERGVYSNTPQGLPCLIAVQDQVTGKGGFRNYLPIDFLGNYHASQYYKIQSDFFF
jgi:hypothetical protein